MRAFPAAAFLVVAVAGCNQGEGTILVTVTADPPLAHVTRLDVTAGSAAPVAVSPQQPFALPPPQTLSIVAPASRGPKLHLKVEARDGDQLVAVGSGDADLSAGKRTDITITLGAGGGPTDDMGGGGDGGGGPTSAPRQRAPISGSTVTSKRPTLRWILPAGVTAPQVDVCATRACDSTLATVVVDATGTAGVPDRDLPRGVVFWRVRATSAGQAVSSKTWELTAPGRTASRDCVQGLYRDFNGDGNADVAIGAVNATNSTGVAKVGRAYVSNFFGSPPVLLESSDAVRSVFGAFVTFAGDVDGNGQSEALINAYYATNNKGELEAGRVYVFSFDGANNKAVIANQIEGAEGTNGIVGLGIGSAGDLNGDGYADIAYYGSNLGDGRIYVVPGSPTGLDLTKTIKIDGPAGGREGFGINVAGADIDGDGYGDLMVGAWVATVGGMSGVGRLYVFHGSPTGIVQPAAQIIDGSDGMNTYFPQMMQPLGDVNGDGYADIMAGDNATTGGIHIFHGGADGKLHEAKKLLPPSAVANSWGNSAGGWADVNCDGYHDLVALSYEMPSKAYLFLGGPDGITTAQGSPLAVGTANAVALPGDMNLDGYADLVVGDSTGAGRIYQYLSTGSGFDPANPGTYDGTDGSGSGFGGSLGRRGAARQRSHR